MGVQGFYFYPRKKNLSPRKFSIFCPRIFQSGREKNLGNSPRKKFVPEKKIAKFYPRKRKTFPRKKWKILPEKILKAPEKNPFHFFFHAISGLMLWWFFLNLFNAFVETLLSLFWPNFVRACGEPQVLWLWPNCFVFAPYLYTYYFLFIWCVWPVCSLYFCDLGYIF